ncbi:ciliogenesis and planar polarity effector 1 [Antennarius striatus]|uniref:ciliogenesis and planar polarity effector 1 n=1 Tax=Antennarius striatus TaxID=241820 RepID=UPI0035B3C4BA
MELNLEVVLSSSIKRKKPWPRFCWLGKEKESVFLLDDKRISEINMVSGRTKKRTPKLHPLLNSVVTMTSSNNGMWLCGLLLSGELFLWNRDKDLLKTAAAAPEVARVIIAGQDNHSSGNNGRLSLQVSGDGMRVLLVAITGQVFLWECMDSRDLMSIRNGTVKGQWVHIQPLENSILPSPEDKEASQHTIFVKTEVLGDACLSAFVFTSRKKLIVTCLKIQWEEDIVGTEIKWATKTYPMSNLTLPCQPVKSRGALVPAFSPDGRLLAIVLNQRQPKATQVLFLSTQNFISVSRGLGGCGSKKLEIPPKYIRSYWVASVSWSPGGLFLACVLKRGSLLMVSRLGGLLSLTSCGCSVEFGPAHFLPLHPLVTYRLATSAGKMEASLSSSSLSVRDVLRQRYSVTWHPRLLYLIVSDGYMATVMRVLHGPSPAMLLTVLLKDIRKDLEKASQKLDHSQVDVRTWLESVSCLNLDSSFEVCNPVGAHEPKTTDSVLSANTDISALPVFLQDQETLGGTKDLLEKVQSFFEDESDFDGAPSGPHLEDNGRLEFASMFDTLHAQDTQTDSGLVTSPDIEMDFDETERKTSSLRHHELAKIRRKLLSAWAFGMSLGNVVENRTVLLRHTLSCVVRLVALLHFIPSSTIHTRKKTIPVSSSLLHLLKAVLSFLPWDGSHSDGQRCLGLVVDFSKRLISLLLTPHPQSQQTGQCWVSSHNLSTALHILQLISDSLDHTYTLQQKNIWASSEKESQPPQVWLSDGHHVPLLQEEKEVKLNFLSQARPDPQRPSSRLLGVWQWIYKITQQCMEELKNFKDSDSWEEEQQQLSDIMFQIQTALQATGERLEEGPALLNYTGEHLFLCGSYPKSADTWRSQICEESNKSCDRSVFKQTQLCLALLYSLLSQYRLREAQEMGDHMACLILDRAGHQKNTISITADALPCPWLPLDLHSDAAFAVVQTLGRFMASYFTNQPLFILPAHHVAILPPLHLPQACSVGRLVPLSQEEVSRAVRQQQLSEVWTVDYAQDLLLLGGLLPETAWLAYHLGAWKTAASLSLAYMNYCSYYFNFSSLRRKEFHLPKALEPESIFQVELERLFSSKSDSQECRDKHGGLSFTEPLEGDDCSILQVSIQEILKAAVMAGVDVISSPLSSLLETAKQLCSGLTTLVPNGVYLPSPPLYCPQPSPNTQDPVEQFGEVSSRHKVSGVLQSLLLLLRAACCSRPAAQWYINRLRRARHILYKIKKTYPYPSAQTEEKAFPEGLIKFISCSGFFKQGPNKDGRLDPDTIQTIICFRELCGLCWMLHVRDQLSISCRKYQAAKQRSRNEQTAADPKVISACVEALCWVRRCLPFSHFLNAEEILQDILLSLVCELPPFTLVADLLVQAFPEEEETVRVPLREKYNSLLQRLRQCNAIEVGKEGKNELMMIVIQDKRRQRRKHLGRLQRHLAPPELHLWETEEKEEDRGSKHGTAVLRKLSLDTSHSSSNSTDCGFPPICSEGDAADTTETMSPEKHSRAKARGKKTKMLKEHGKKSAVKTDSINHNESQSGNAKGPCLPVVGTWEFELDDDEYLNFLELFLSYVLEKDAAHGRDSGFELPLLKNFSSKLKKRELQSLSFDVLTTIHRRQRDANYPVRKHLGKDPPVFKAGCCFKPMKLVVTPEPQASSVWSEALGSRTSHSVSSLPGLRIGKQKGLFGLRQQSIVSSGQRINGDHFDSESRLILNASSMGQLSESLKFGSSTSVQATLERQQGLDPTFEAQFPKLGRLLEWMVRWADRKVLLGHHGKKKKDTGGVFEGTATEGVVIRVKAFTPTILTSLTLLQNRYNALLETDHHRDHIQFPAIQYIVAPVLQSEVDQKLENESSVSSSNSGSANEPNAGLDLNLQQEEVSFSSFTEEPEEERVLPNEQNQQSFDAQQTHISQRPSVADFIIALEKEDKNSVTDDSEVSSLVSNENYSEKICTPETSLKVEDLDISENAEDISNSTLIDIHTQSPQAPPLQEPRGVPAVQEEAEVHAELSGSVGLHHPNTPMDSSSLQPQNSEVDAPAANFTAPHQPLPNLTPPMRQRLGEDLYRLVQNINYMSLMEVLGASFSNLHLAQQSSSLAQSNINYSQPNVPSSSASNSTPQPHVLPVQTNISVTPQNQACVPGLEPTNAQSIPVPAAAFTDQPSRQSPERSPPTNNQRHITRTPSCNVNSASVNYQKMQPLSVQAVSSEGQIRGSGSLIPPSQGLLATTDAINNAAVILPHDNTHRDPASLPFGLKLLRCPPSAHHTSTPRYPTVHKSKTDDESVFSKKVQPKTQTSGGFRGQELPLLPSVSSIQGLRQQHFQPAPQTHITFPKLPLPSSSRPPMFIAAPRGEVQYLKLLHIKSGPKMILPTAVPSAQTTNLISMEGLTSSVRQNAEEAQVQLLGLASPIERTRKAIGSPSSHSSRREKQKEKKAEKERKTEVTFRPDDSIIFAKTPSNENVYEEALAADENSSGQDAAVPFVPESFDSLLTGQRLLDKAMSTSAELHAFASTNKRPPECNDAFTNTDPVSPRPLVDKAVSTSVTISIPKSQGNLQFSLEVPVKDTQTQRSEKNLDLDCRQFISVLDLEDKNYHQDLPVCLSPRAPDIPLSQSSAPTSAELHVLATSVICAAAADVKPINLIPEDPVQPTTHAELSSLNHTEPSLDPDRTSTQDTENLFDPKVRGAIKTQSFGRHHASSTPPTVWFSTRLSELDVQLASLQNIADFLETDLCDSRMLVNTIEKLTPVSAADVKTCSNHAEKRTVRLSVPKEAWTPRLDISSEPIPFETDEEKQEEAAAAVHDGPIITPEWNPFILSSTSHCHKAGPSYIHIPTKTRDQLAETSETSFVMPDENPSQTELSDTAELLDELAQEGYLCQADLDLSNSQTAHCSRIDQQESSWTSGRRPRTEEERRELRIWMRRKQRESLAVYQKHRGSLREREHKPYSPCQTAKPTMKNTTTIWRTRQDKEKLRLLEQYSQRVHDACSLAIDLPTDPASTTFSQPGSPVLSPAQSISSPQPGATHRAHSLSTIDKRNPKSGQDLLHLYPRTPEKHMELSEAHDRRLGLHRPATSLPRDRLSQLTRRGMLTYTKSDSNQRVEQHAGSQRKIGSKKVPSGLTAARKGILREHTRIENVLEPPSRLNRLLGPEDSTRFIVGLLNEADDGAGADVSDFDWLDNLSEAGSSTLSNIDWDAIERMADEEEP